MKTYLSVFMKSPGSGAKTRLRRCLSEANVVRLYEAFVEDTLEKLKACVCDVKVICYAGEPPPGGFSFSGDKGLRFVSQDGSHLGERLKNYFDWSFSQGAGKSIVIGSDSPTLPTCYLEQAFFLLGTYEVVIGPSLDGGYYLIGMSRPHPELFDNISWSTSSVLRETLSQNRHLQGKLGLLAPWYDVDTPEDLFFLKEHLQKMRVNDEAFPERTFHILSELRV